MIIAWLGCGIQGWFLPKSAFNQLIFHVRVSTVSWEEFMIEFNWEFGRQFCVHVSSTFHNFHSGTGVA